MGENVSYWMEAKRQIETIEADHLFREIAKLRAKVSFYENRLKELNDFMAANLEIK